MKSGLTIRRGEKRISHRGRRRDRLGWRRTVAGSGTETFSDSENSRARVRKIRWQESQISQRANHRGRTPRKFVRPDRHRILQLGGGTFLNVRAVLRGGGGTLTRKFFGFRIGAGVSLLYRGNQQTGEKAKAVL